MAVIHKKGDFDFFYQSPNFRTLKCAFKDGRLATVNFDKLELSYSGTVRIWVENCNSFVTLSQILPKKEEDEKYFDFISKEIKVISNKRKRELKKNKKEEKRKKTETIR